jgi:hypothetical protein
VLTGSSYSASSDPRVHLGLGGRDRVDAVEVRWVGGDVETRGPLEANRVHRIVRGARAS